MQMKTRKYFPKARSEFFQLKLNQRWSQRNGCNEERAVWELANMAFRGIIHKTPHATILLQFWNVLQNVTLCYKIYCDYHAPPPIVNYVHKGNLYQKTWNLIVFNFNHLLPIAVLVYSNANMWSTVPLLKSLISILYKVDICCPCSNTISPHTNIQIVWCINAPPPPNSFIGHTYKAADCSFQCFNILRQSNINNDKEKAKRLHHCYSSCT